MIDSDTANSLTDVDVGYAILLGGLLGAGLAMANPSTSSRMPTRADVTFINDIAETLDSAFVKEFAETVVAFHLVPDDDRAFLADNITLKTYAALVRELAEERTTRGIRNIDSVTLGWLTLGRIASTR